MRRRDLYSRRLSRNDKRRVAAAVLRNRLLHIARLVLRTAFLLLMSFRQRSAVPYPAIGFYTLHSPSCGQLF